MQTPALNTTFFLKFSVLSTLALLFTFLPLLTLHAQTPDPKSDPTSAKFQLVPCGTGKPDKDGKISDECTFADLIILGQRIINYLMYLAIIIAAIAFAIAGFKLLTAGGDPGQVSDAKKMFGSVLTGLIWILVAWLVVYTIVTALVPKTDTQNGVQTKQEDYLLLK